MQTFDLQKLPLLATANTLVFMNPFELAQYALCSKNCKRLAKSISRRAEKIVLNLNADISITIHFSDTCITNFEFFVREEPEVAFISVTTSGNAFSPDDSAVWHRSVQEPRLDLSVAKWAEHLCELFHRDLDEVNIGTRYGAPKTATTRHYFAGKTLTVKNLTIGVLSDNSNFYHERLDVQFLLETFHPTDSLMTSDFQHFPGFRNFQMERLSVIHSGMIRLEDLLHMECVDVELGETQITSGDFNKFLRNCWMKGGVEKLESLKMRRLEGYQEREVIRDIPHEKVPLKIERTWILKKTDRSLKVTFRGGIDIRAENGTKATIRVDAHMISFHVWK